MSIFRRLRTRVGRMSLKTKLPIGFAGVALLTMLVLGAILVPVLGNYYSRSETSYLQAGAEQAAADLAKVDWTTVADEVPADGTTNPGGQSATMVAQARRQVQAVALSTQLRIRVFSPNGTLLVDSGPVDSIDATGILEADDDEDTDDEHGQGRGMHGMPNPMGQGLLGGGRSGEGQRSDRVIETELTDGEQTVAIVRLSEGPAYSSTALKSALIAWLLAGVAAVLLAAVVGWLMSRRLTKPLLAITAASDGMAHGDLTVRTEVHRADEIGSLAASFNAMADKMQHTVSALRRFVADAAHELGTPLTALEADLELAQSQEDETERSRLIGRAMRQAERIDRLSTDLLLLSRLDAGTMPTSLEPIDLVAVARQVADSAASRAEQAGLDFTLELPAEELRVMGHTEGLRTALSNLVDNALKFTPAGGSVTLGAKAQDQTAVVWVKDTGIGIPAEDLDDLFSRFHRGRNVSAYPGSGLGLAIVKATIDIHGGVVAAESSPRGSQFELRLPLI
jgi:signal transduction histidine kinase